MRYVILVAALALAGCSGSPLQPDPISDAVSPLTTQDSHQSFGGKVLTTLLRGIYTVPPSDAPGVGHVSLSFNHGKNRLCFVISAIDTDPPLGAAVYKGAFGVAGSWQFDLAAAFTGTYKNCLDSVDHELLVDLFGTPSDYYVLIWTANDPLPAGAIRGQLSR